MHDWIPNDFLKAFKSGVVYIYDRMSLDRLFRTHWLLNQCCFEQNLKEWSDEMTTDKKGKKK